jgi:hypothetical protein
MIVVHDYRGYGIGINAVPADEGRWNAVVRVRLHFPVEAKPHVETVTCYRMTAELAERAAELWARRWIDVNGDGSQHRS